MNRFVWLLENKPLIFVHLSAALLALSLGAVVLARRKGTTPHRATYIGGCVVAGLFTLMPGRFLGRQLWSLIGAA
jgi:uncharacterized membrane protein